MSPTCALGRLRKAREAPAAARVLPKEKYRWKRCRLGQIDAVLMPLRYLFDIVLNGISHSVTELCRKNGIRFV